MSTETEPRASESDKPAAIRSHPVIVAATDLEQDTDTAIRLGVEMAYLLKAELHIVHAIGTPSMGFSKAARIEKQSEALAKVPERIKPLVKSELALLGITSNVPVMIHALNGRPVDAILQFTVDVQANLLVVGTHDRSGVRRLVMGSTAEALMHEAHCPVAVARPLTYAGLSPSDRVEPPCKDCIAIRKESGRARMWCDLHSRQHVSVHVHGGGDSGAMRSSWTIHT